MFTKTPTKGMRDFLPEEVLFRQRVLNSIESTYKKYGFSRIETPAVESLQLLESKEGGDNEKLIFKILKRGEKLTNAEEGELCDLGLRYDLTVPLARYFANNCGRLPSVTKTIQIDNVWRADRPQKGRFRQFVQCDIDMIGESSNLAEIELISATGEALTNLGFKNVTVRLNDRRLLLALVKFCGFEQKNTNAVLIALDKMDKIGVTGVMEEIEALESGKVEQFLNFIGKVTKSQNPLETAVKMLGHCLEEEVFCNLQQILSVCGTIAKGVNVVFDITLVRGMDYYTGTIFELTLENLGLSAGGGGRYDKLIGKITGNDVPACGFSIGFERIIMLLQQAENNKIAMLEEEKLAILIPKDINQTELSAVLETASRLRKGCDVSVYKKIKNFSFQLQQLKALGFKTIYEFFNGELRSIKL